METIVFGTAFEANPGTDEYRIRVYRYWNRTFIGHDSQEVIHTHGPVCTAQALPNEYLPADGSASAYVSIHPYVGADGLTYVRTADVGEFDPGDDPYVACEACGAKLLEGAN